MTQLTHYSQIEVFIWKFLSTNSDISIHKFFNMFFLRFLKKSENFDGFDKNEKWLCFFNKNKYIDIFSNVDGGVDIIFDPWVGQ